MRFEPSAVDFGIQTPGLRLAAVVKMTNASDRELDILRVTSDCSCTAGAPQQLKLAPGESTLLPVDMETPATQGEVLRRLTVETSAGNAELTVKAAIRAFANWDVTPHPVTLPVSLRRQAAASSVAVRYLGPESITLLGATTDKPWLSVEFIGSPDGRGGNLILRKNADAPTGRHQAELRLQTSDLRELPPGLQVFVPVLSAAKVTPNPIVLPTVSVGTTATREVVVSGWDEAAAPAGRMPLGSVEVKGPRPNGDYVLIIAVTPASAGMNAQMLQLFAEPNLPLIEVPVMLKAEPKR